MPFLRGGDGAAHELRSSKTLIGASPSKCDVVVRHTDVLDLHALLNLSGDKSSGNLVPFSAQASGGVCYLNDRVVPIEGAPVVHGDRIAFGDPATSFIFELTSSSPQRLNTNPFTNASANNSTASSRRALDALRGDRTASPRGSMVSKRTPTQRKPDNAKNQSNASLLGSTSNPKSNSKSDEQLGRFLLDASSDSLLSDFVERKLRQSSASSSNRRKKRVTPMAMEPPPSLSASSASFVSSSSSMRSALEDSILSRTSNMGKSSRSNAMGSSIGPNERSSRLSTAERNYAEIEKLRLSQQLREVNSILNGQTEFNASCLASSDGNPKRTRRLELAEDRALLQSCQSVSENEDDDDELPVTMEKKPQPAVVSALAAAAPLLSPEPSAATVDDRDDEEGDEESTSLNESLPSFSEPMLRSDPHERRRGLRIQNQNRQQRAQQIHKLKAKLVLLRRNRLFFRWKALAGVSSQVLSCRVDAFQERAERRMLVSTWTQWKLKHFAQLKRRRQLLQSAIGRMLMKSKQRAFYKWQIATQALQNRAKLEDNARQNQQTWGMRSCKVAESHHTQRLINPMLGRILRNWNASTKLQMKKLHILRKLTLRGALKLKQRGWRQWQQVVVLSRHADAARREHKARIDGIITHERAQQQQQRTALAEAHSEELRNLQKQLEGKQKELLELQQREKARERELHKLRQLQSDSEQRKATQKQEWTQSLESYFESAVKRCDRQIAQASKNLEQILELAEEDVSGARFVAARVLVETMLEQKVHNSNERIETQETLLVQLASMSQQQQLHGRASVSLQGDSGEQAMSNNAKFLRDMVQQRPTRSHQLLGAVAKLAAAALDDNPQQQQQFDPVKLRHSTFLTDAILQRQQRHTKEMTAILFKLTRCTSSSSKHTDGGGGASPPAATA